MLSREWRHKKMLHFFTGNGGFWYELCGEKQDSPDDLWRIDCCHVENSEQAGSVIKQARTRRKPGMKQKSYSQYGLSNKINVLD